MFGRRESKQQRHSALKNSTGVTGQDREIDEIIYFRKENEECNSMEVLVEELLVNREGFCRLVRIEAR